MSFDVSLNEDVDALREAVKRFADVEVAPLAEQVDRDNEFPMHLWEKFGEMGLLGITIPEQYGGSGLSYLSHLVAVEELSRASASIGLSYGAHSNLCVNNLYLNGSEAQRVGHGYVPSVRFRKRCSAASAGDIRANRSSRPRSGQCPPRGRRSRHC